MRIFWQGLASIGLTGVLASVLMVVLVTGATTVNAQAETILTVQQAHDKALAGGVLLVDVRSPAEWRQTGP